MALNVLSQFDGGFCDPPRGEQIDQPKVSPYEFDIPPSYRRCKEFQRLGCLANADTNHTERPSNLRFNGQSISGDEFVHDDVPLGLFGGLFAEFPRLDHLVSLEGSLA